MYLKQRPLRRPAASFVWATDRDRSVFCGGVPKWLKGPDSKSGRSVPPALGFKSPHLRQQNIQQPCGLLDVSFFWPTPKTDLFWLIFPRLWEKPPGRSHNLISRCYAVGSASALEQEARGSSTRTPTMRSVLIGSEYGTLCPIAKSGINARTSGKVNLRFENTAHKIFAAW